MWQKWVMIASLGLVTCLLNGPIGEINAVPYGEETALHAIDECAAVGAACGFPLPQSLPRNASMRQAVTTKGSNLTSSMYRDLQKGAPVEVDAILGDLLDHGRSHNVDTPLLQAGCVRLRVYQNSTVAESPIPPPDQATQPNHRKSFLNQRRSLIEVAIADPLQSLNLRVFSVSKHFKPLTHASAESPILETLLI